MNLLITLAAPGLSARLLPDTDFADIVRQYIADCEASPGREQALKGLA